MVVTSSSGVTVAPLEEVCAVVLVTGPVVEVTGLAVGFSLVVVTVSTVGEVSVVEFVTDSVVEVAALVVPFSSVVVVVLFIVVSSSGSFVEIDSVVVLGLDVEGIRLVGLVLLAVVDNLVVSWIILEVVGLGVVVGIVAEDVVSSLKPPFTSVLTSDTERTRAIFVGCISKV
ncbi:hypothetical protein NECAME_13849 [Necator americanus]|uniref:Uncharacterized protein n=1 Tax=Necator americanus TaxID=51031 RepID=W2SRW3_NECAM|nr:hypothetical protein NECAME_13849 [Necator americanus]ETN72484.1 hypothetical protein NECAME_13849 [Necator americanus]